MDDESPGLGLDLPEQPQKSDEASPYRVLARKYRPQTFAELIGQDAMVKTLGNAIERGRIAHAFLLTGVRGVGKMEVDGEAHARGDRPARDAVRDAWLVSQGVRVLRYPAQEVLTNLEGVVRQIIAIALDRRDERES